MRIHIQDCQSRKYLHGQNQWVLDKRGAANFANSMEAFRHCLRDGLAGVNIIIEFDSRRPPLTIPFDVTRPVEPARAAMA